MPTAIEWRYEPADQHTGSAELLGGIGTPMIYCHPRDQAGTPIASPACGWTYTLQDLAVQSVAATALELRVAGRASYARFARDWIRYQQLGAPPGPDTFNGQQNARATLGVVPRATGLQPSGGGQYRAYLKVVPPVQTPRTVQVAATLRAAALTGATFNAQIGGSRSLFAAARVLDGTQEVTRIRLTCRIRAPFNWRSTGTTATYPVVVPAGQSVLIGELSIGPGFVIRAGSCGFRGGVRVEFVVT